MNAHTHGPGGHISKRPTRLLALALAPVIALLALAGASPALVRSNGPGVVRGYRRRCRSNGPANWCSKTKSCSSAAKVPGPAPSRPSASAKCEMDIQLHLRRRLSYGKTILRSARAALAHRTRRTQRKRIQSPPQPRSRPQLYVEIPAQMQYRGGKVNEECALEGALAASLTKTKTGVTETVGKLKGPALSAPNKSNS